MSTADPLGCIRTCSSLRTWNLSSGFVGFALGCWSWTGTWFGFQTCLHSCGSAKDSLITLDSVIGLEGSLFLSLDSAHVLHSDSVRNRPEISDDVGPVGSDVFGL